MDSFARHLLSTPMSIHFLTPRHPAAGTPLAPRRSDHVKFFYSTLLFDNRRQACLRGQELIEAKVGPVFYKRALCRLLN